MRDSFFSCGAKNFVHISSLRCVFVAAMTGTAPNVGITGITGGILLLSAAGAAAEIVGAAVGIVVGAVVGADGVVRGF